MCIPCPWAAWAASSLPPRPSFLALACGAARARAPRRAAPSADYDCVKTPISALSNVHYRENVEARVFTLLPIERCTPLSGQTARTIRQIVLESSATYVDKRLFSRGFVLVSISPFSRGRLVFARRIKRIAHLVASPLLVSSRRLAARMWFLQEEKERERTRVISQTVLERLESKRSLDSPFLRPLH